MIILLFFLLAIIIILIMYIIIEKKYSKKPNKQSKSTNCDSELINKVNIRKSIGIKSIKDNLITTKNNEKVCLLDVSTPDVSLLTNADQELYENRLIEFMLKLNYNMKVITIVESKDTRKIIKKLQENNKYINDENLSEYSKNLINELINEQQDYDSKKYYVISDNDEKELNKKVNKFIDSMLKAGCSIRILETNEIIEVTNKLIKKYDKLDVQELEKKGAFDIAM